MAVTSTTLAGVNVWQFSGAVTDAEIKTAWSATISNGVYIINRAIYLTNTCDLSGVQGGFLVDFGTQVLPGVLLHTTRDKAKTIFKNFTFFMRTGLSVPNRGGFVKSFDGTSIIALQANDGMQFSGGGFIYAVAGNPGGGDPRYLLELGVGDAEGASFFAQAYTEQEPNFTVNSSKIFKGINLHRVIGFPQSGGGSTTRHVVYRSTINTMHSVQFPIRLFEDACACYVSSYATRNSADITANLADTYASTGSCRIVILNNWRKESWFGVSKASISVSNWSSGNQFIGGILKKFQFIGGGGGTLRVYDSRSTTTPQKSNFKEVGFSDFVDSNTSPVADALGKIDLIFIAAIATGVSPPAITRYSSNRYTFQKFNYKVEVQNIDTTLEGDTDLSAYTPYLLTPLSYVTRTQSAINSATTIDNLDQLAEELHNFSLTQVGATSYNGLFSGNFHQVSGDALDLGSANVIIDSALASKLAYNNAINAFSFRPSSIFQKGSLITKLKTTGTVTVVTEVTNLSLIGSVTQSTPTNLSGISITGNLTYNTNTDVAVTLTNCNISGTVSNSGTGNVKLNLINSTVNTGANVTAQYPITVIDAKGANFSTQIWVFNSLGNIVEDTGFNSLVASKTVYLPVGGSIRVYSQAYGTLSKITNTNATNASLVITHIPETLVDTSLSIVTRDLIASYFSSIIDGSILYVEVDTDLVSYTPAEVLNGMHYFIVSNGGNFAALSLLANSVGSVQLIDGGFRVYSQFFKGRAKSNLNSTNTPSLFITLPLYIEDATDVPGNQIMIRNLNGIDVHSALWSKATANISSNDMVSIAGTTWSYGSRTLNGAIFE